MGANQSYLQKRVKLALIILETITPQVSDSNPSLLLLVNYLHTYASSASSFSHFRFTLVRLNHKLQAYITSASSTTASTTSLYQNPPQSSNARFIVQFDYDHAQLGYHLQHVQACSEVLELFEQILTALRRKEVLDLKHFVIKKPREKMVKMASCSIETRDELEAWVEGGPVGGYASMKEDADEKQGKTDTPCGEGHSNQDQRRGNLMAPHSRSSSIYSTTDSLSPKPLSVLKKKSFSKSVREARFKPSYREFANLSSEDAWKLFGISFIEGNEPIEFESTAIPLLDNQREMDSTAHTRTTSFESKMSPTVDGMNIAVTTNRENSIYTNSRKSSWSSSVYSQDSEGKPINGSIISPSIPDKRDNIYTPLVNNSTPRVSYDSAETSSTAISTTPSLETIIINNLRTITPISHLFAEQNKNNIANTSTPPDIIENTIFTQPVAPKAPLSILGLKNRNRKTRVSEILRVGAYSLKSFYPVKQDFEGVVEGCRVCLKRRDVVEVRVESSGSYVKVDAWVPLEGVRDFLFLQPEDRVI